MYRKINTDLVVSLLQLAYNGRVPHNKSGLLRDMARRTIRTKRKIARSRLPLQQQLGPDTEVRYFDLRGLFSKLNARHFVNRLRGYKMVWGRKRRERPKEYFIFGTIQEEDRVIRINPWLDQRFVP